MLIAGFPALGMQLPSEVVLAPDVHPVDGFAIRALVEFHKGAYQFPESPAEVVKHLVVADIIRDDTF